MATMGGRKMTNKRQRDALDELEQQINDPRANYIYPWVRSYSAMANRYKAIAKELTDESRKKQALEKAAKNYHIEASMFGNHYRADDLIKAIEMYEDAGETEWLKVAREDLKKENRRKSEYYLGLLVNEHRQCEIDFSNIIRLPKWLTDAGLPELAEKYQIVVEEIIRFAKQDLETLVK